MAARRLLIVMLLLLAVSTLAAALIPPEARRQGTSSTATSTTTTGPTSDATGGRLIERTVSAAGDGSTPIEMRLGDQLALTVRLRFADQVQIPAFGLLANAAPGAPARFDLLPDRKGRFDVELVDAGRVVAVIRVAPTRDGGRR